MGTPKRPRRWMPAGAGLLCVLGCVPTSPGPVARLVAQPRPYFSDVPVPVGFTINEAESVDHLTGQRRIYVHHLYEGRSDPYAVREFYLEHMPQRHWQMAHATSEDGVQTMQFRKGSEACTLRISRLRSGRIRVGVTIWPAEAQAQTPSAKNRP